MAGHRKCHLTAAQQYFFLRHNSICRGDGTWCRRSLVWGFPVTPSPLSRTYRVRIEYQEQSAPEVRVIDPDLQILAGERKLPHTYAGDPPLLCLYLPRTREWSPDLLIAATIVPWTYLWLFFFEEWLLTNEWKGGGEHPEVNNE